MKTRAGRVVYYNESDPRVLAWLRDLIECGELPEGELDDRSIVDVEGGTPSTQAHFFAGIGGWPLALKWARVPLTASVWTGSCPCQPFSSAGQRKGFDDDKHLWPAWFELIKKRKPTILFGEQVASPIARAWLDAVFADLEGTDYACAASDLPAASVGAPHVRQRLYWVAHADLSRRDRKWLHARQAPDPIASVWRHWIPLRCADTKRRPTEPGVDPVAHGLPGFLADVGGYGNAVVPQLAAEFVISALEAICATA